MPTLSNDQILLNQILSSFADNAPPGMSQSELFEYFTADQILKDLNLSTDEISNGVVDGNGDGGIDCIYTFANEVLVEEDFDYNGLTNGFALDLYIIQSKTESSFGETALEKLNISLNHLLDLSSDIDPALYSEAVIDRMKYFRDLCINAAGKYPKVKVHIYYVSKGSTNQIGPRINSKMAELQRQVEEKISGSTTTVELIGSKELKELAGKMRSETYSLKFEGHYSKPGQNSYIALIPIANYADFLSDESGRLRNFMFESNVRDYQGTTTVNTAIRDSLNLPFNDGDPDFWWLNNGVTIICSNASIMGDIFTLKDVQIVNGLQTSTHIYEHFKNLPETHSDSRVVLVRIITTPDELVRNRIIRATNHQNTLPTFAMRATEAWQKDIQNYFESQNYFYDRRKNYYKNQGKPASKIITIPYLAQAVISIGFSQPDSARAHPSKLVTSDDTYDKIFDIGSSLSGYLWMAKLQKRIDLFLRESSFDQTIKSNIRFHLSMLVAHNLLGERIYDPSQLLLLFGVEIDNDILESSASELISYLNEYRKQNPGSTVDSIAKSKSFTEFIVSKKYN